MNAFVLSAVAPNGLNSLDSGAVGALTVAFFAVVGVTFAYLIVRGVLSANGRKKGKARGEIKSFHMADAKSFRLAEPVRFDAKRRLEETEAVGGEIIAVISAAVAAFAEAEGKRYEIKSVKKKVLRSAWGKAGVWENIKSGL
ncbi:MAG: hypothetical protein LBI38_06910 [Oscillospiraceae bacterium]|jgi:hypothetical protein|nr:hypothetical protein [Oscillospiraceae bacterium]